MYRLSSEREVSTVPDSRLTDPTAKITSVLAKRSENENARSRLPKGFSKSGRTYPVVLSSAGIGLSLIAASSSEYFSSNTVLCS